MFSMLVNVSGAQNSLKEKMNSFFLTFDQGIYNFGEIQKSIQDAFSDMYCPTCPNEKRVHLSTTKLPVSTTVRSAKPTLRC